MRDIKFKIISWIILAVGILGFIPGFLPFRTGKIILVEFALFSAIALWFIKNIWLKIFLLWCVVRVAMGINQYSELSLHLLVFVLVFYQILSEKLNKDRVVHLLNVICCIAIIQSVMVILQRCGVWWCILPLKYKDFHSVVFFKNSFYPLFIFNPPVGIDTIGGFVGDHNAGAALLGMCLPAFFRRKWCYVIPLIVIAFISIHAFGGILAGLIAAIVFLFIKFGKKCFYGIIPIGLLFLAYICKFESIQNILHSGTGRYPVWQFHVQHLIPKRPIIGWGLGQAEFLWPIIQKETHNQSEMFWHSHNEVITLVTELGVIGLILACGYFISTFKKLKDPVIVCGLVACLVAALSYFTLHSAIGLILVAYMAIAQCIINYKGKNELS